LRMIHSKSLFISAEFRALSRLINILKRKIQDGVLLKISLKILQKIQDGVD